MLSTKHLINDYKTVPTSWIFEYYCKLPEKLTGQDIKITSVFKPEEKTPSLCIYCDPVTELYKYKCYSTGKSGASIDFVKDITGLPFHSAARKIVDDYNEFQLHCKNSGLDVDEFKRRDKYKVTKYEVRSWNTRDQYFWTQFNIGTKLLNKYFICPLKEYRMEKKEDGEVHSIVISGEYIYGYFTREGVLYKIYQPKVKTKKFIKVQNYIQGSEQLQNHPHLVIASSLKDILSLKSLGLKVDIIAPDSENTMIHADKMKKYIETYPQISVLLDNDEAGINAMKKYRELYGITPILFRLAKDPSDGIKEHGVEKVKYHLVPMLNSVPLRVEI